MEPAGKLKPSARSIAGCLIGGAAGDSLGLCCEGISPRRIKLLYPDVSRHRFLFGRGMISDDTEHSMMAAAAVAVSRGDEKAFLADFEASLRRWLFTLPPGVGFATLRACLKLAFFFSPENSGVFSAGNGPAMRSAVLGAALGGDIELMKKFVRASARVTHADPKAYEAALAVALAAKFSSEGRLLAGEEFAAAYAGIASGAEGEELAGLLRRAAESVRRGEGTAEFASALCGENGVSGYSFHTVPAVIHCWLKNGSDFRGAIIEMISCGGDADTTAAILGGIIGAGTGPEGVPAEWTGSMISWPYTIECMRRAADAAAASLSAGPAGEAPPHAAFKRPSAFFSFLRNLLTIAAIPFHVVRRCLPPY